MNQSVGLARGKSALLQIDIFADVFMENDDLLWPLFLVDPRDKEQFKVLFPIMKTLPHTVHLKSIHKIGSCSY